MLLEISEAKTEVFNFSQLIFELKGESCEFLGYPFICDDYPFSSEMSCDFADESLEHKFHIFKSMH